MSSRTEIELSPFGSMMREWRALRGMSQLSLGLTAGVSARHISFIETGRAKPSRSMVLMLADALDMPLRARNALLEHAGFAHVYSHRPLDHPEMAQAKRAIDIVLKAHEPWAAFAFDPCWDLIELNPPARKMLAVMGIDAEDKGNNLARMVMGDGVMRALIANWDEVAHHMMLRLEVEARRGSLASRAQELIEELGMANVVFTPDAEPDPVLPLKLNLGDQVISLITVVTTIGTAQDVGLSELRIETFVPVDDASEAAIRSLLA